MRLLLAIGATICCVVGIIFFSELVSNFGEVWRDSSNHVYIILGYFLVAGYPFLTFAPMIMLFQYRRIEIPRRRLVFIGLVELFVILVFLSLLPAKGHI
jgi:hypothetical protein